MDNRYPLGGKLEVIVHQGYDCIGGNIIELDYGEGSIIFDFGLNISKLNQFYTWPFRQPEGVKDIIRIGAAPDIPELYTEWDESGRTPIITDEDVKYRAVFISHAHLDHIGLLPYINRNIPVYIGETSKVILDVRIETSYSRKYYTYEGIKFNTFRSGDKIRVDDIEVIPIHVDHSIPGSYSFIVETPEGSFIYTGDYRLHGQDRSLTMDLIDKASQMDIDLLITEGTRVFDVSMMREEDVRRNMKEIFSKHSENVILETSRVDFDRFISILRAAGETSRRIVLTEGFLIYIGSYYLRDRKLKKKLNEAGFSTADIIGITREGRTSRRRRYIKEVVSQGVEIIDYNRYSVDKRDIVLGIYEGLEIASKKGKDSSWIAIFSNSEPFDEEGEIDYNKIVNWLSLEMIPSIRIHSSGHISPLDLKELVNTINPRDVMVIHSEYPNLIKRFIRG